MASVLVALCVIPLVSLAHHSSSGRYDTEIIIEIEGTVTELRWRNPHVYLTVETSEQNGERVSWELESGAPNSLLRSGVSRDSIKVGDRIKAAGRAPLTTAKEIFVMNILVPGGEELLMLASAEPRWNEERTGDYSYWNQQEGDSSRPELGIFRVWSTTLSSRSVLSGARSLRPDGRPDLSDFPMTEAAQTALQQFNPATDNPTRNCTPKGMPTIMDQPYPVEFEQNANDILMRIEEYDVLRTIHMDREAAPVGESASPLGNSIGRWDGATLLVTTTHLDWPFVHQLGIPQSRESVLVERFSPTEDGSRLDYELTITDPVNFTEPVTAEKYWLYIPGEEIRPYDCTLRV
jgi:hypothetical protein